MEESSSVARDSAYHACTLPIFPLSEKAAHWILVVGGSVGISKYDVNDSISLTLPESPNYDVTPSILFSPPVMYLFVRSVAALVDEGSAADAVFCKGTFFEVGELATHFFVTCDEESAIFETSCVVYG